MADQQPGVWGIDIGQCALKAIRLEIIDDQVAATAFDYVEHPKILSQPDADPDQLTREALEKFLSRNTLRGDAVSISVAGQSGLARFVKLPPVEEKKIPDIVRFEAKQQIPFPLDEVVWDYQKIGSGSVTGGFAMETEIGLFAIKRDMVNRAMQQFNDVNVEVHVIQMAPLALCNFLAFDLLGKGGPGAEEEDEEKTSERRCVVALDIGTDNSNLVITDGARIIWQRPIPFGGNHFTRALTKDLKLTFAKAEHLKRNATKSPDLKKILTSLKPVLNDFVNEVQRSLGYFTNTHRNAHVEYLVGLGNAFRLPGLQKFLSEKLQLDVRKLAKMERLGGETVTGAPAFTGNILSFATAYGLAVQGLKVAKLQTNLLPREIQFERMVRAKKPWALAGAAALLLGLLGPTVYYSLQFRAVAASSIADAINESMPTIKRNDDGRAAYEAKKKLIDDKEQAVKNIIAGQEERLNWMLLNEYVNACLPSPGMRLEGKLKAIGNGQFVVADAQGRDRPFNENDTTLLAKGNVPTPLRSFKVGDDVGVIYNQLDPKAQKYWNQSAREAYLKVIERQAVVKGPDSKANEEGVENLIQINVEAVYPLFCNNLKGYYDRLQLDMKNRDLKEMLPKEELESAPEGKGWIVEIRGYTYHKDIDQFLLATLLHNLKTLALAKDQLAKKDAGAAPTNTANGTSPDKAAGAKPAPAPDPALEKAKNWHKVLGAEDKDGKPQRRISYVVLYNFQSSPPSDNPSQFELINGSVVSRLAGTNVAAASRGPEGTGGERAGYAGGGGKTGGAWQPLAAMDSGGSGGQPIASREGRPTTERPAVLPGAPVVAGAEPAAKIGPKRVEFIMLFIWKEPTPSDKADTSTPEASPGATEGAPPTPGGLPAGVGGLPAGVGGGRRKGGGG